MAKRVVLIVLGVLLLVIGALAASRWRERLLRRSLACAWRVTPSQLGCRVGLAGSDRDFPRLLPDQARNGHALTSGSI